MPRSTNSVASKARKKKVLKQAKGFFGRRKNVYTVAKNAVDKAMQYAYIGRKLRKRDFRGLWIQRINAAARLEGLSYSKLMGMITASGIEINRKTLADLAMNDPAAFSAIVAEVSGGSAPKKEAAKPAVAKETKEVPAKEEVAAKADDTPAAE